jgi:hypothetical protein
VAEISETKTPKPGEWWLRNSGGRIFYISGFNPEGWVVHWNEDVGFFSSKMRFFCKEFRHEPRCTGFGWVKPPAEDPNDMPLNPVPGKVVATGTVTLTPVTPPDDMAAIIAEHTQQVRELTQRIGELCFQVNQRDAMIEQIRTALHQDFSV